MHFASWWVIQFLHAFVYYKNIAAYLQPYLGVCTHNIIIGLTQFFKCQIAKIPPKAPNQLKTHIGNFLAA